MKTFSVLGKMLLFISGRTITVYGNSRELLVTIIVHDVCQPRPSEQAWLPSLQADRCRKLSKMLNSAPWPVASCLILIPKACVTLLRWTPRAYMKQRSWLFAPFGSTIAHPDRQVVSKWKCELLSSTRLRLGGYISGWISAPGLRKRPSPRSDCAACSNSLRARISCRRPNSEAMRRASYSTVAR